ncbi:MAG: cytochrome c maturation protein CcmE [Pseudomonadota bacterium]
MTRKQKRLTGIAVIGAVIAVAALLVTTALRDEIVFFYDPTDVIEHAKVAPGQKFRLGGLVADGSVQKNQSEVQFVITDGANNIAVSYDGLLPDLFREGQGVIAEGQLNPSGGFTASNILAKHDENYIPKELEDVLKDKDVWKGGSQQ